MHRIYGFIAATALGLLCTGVVLAAAGATFDQSWWSFNAGGNRQSAHFLLQDSAGQSVAGVTTSGTFRLESGFIPGLIGIQTGTPSANHLFMPAVRTGAHAAGDTSIADPAGLRAAEPVFASTTAWPEIPAAADAASTPTPASALPPPGALNPSGVNGESSNHVYLPLMDR